MTIENICTFNEDLILDENLIGYTVVLDGHPIGQVEDLVFGVIWEHSEIVVRGTESWEEQFFSIRPSDIQMVDPGARTLTLYPFAGLIPGGAPIHQLAAA